MSTKLGTLTRAVAIDALTHVLTRNMHADAALDRLFAHHNELRPLDRAFIFEMVYGSLRWLSKMDWIVGHMMDRPFQSLDPRVANALRVGAYQVYYMDRVPDRAAVSETVEAVRSVGAGNASSFVNAILRRVARKAEYFAKPDKEKSSVEYLAMHHAHPRWLVERWQERIPAERLEHLLNGNNSPPRHFLRQISRNPVPTGEDLSTYLLRVHGISSQTRPLRGSLRVEKLPDFARCEAFQAGCYYVQDESSQLTASLVRVPPGGAYLDACAAPGGKSASVWDSGLEAEAMTLCDFSQKRLNVLSQNLERIQLKPARIVHGDAAALLQGQRFDSVLLDAPCTTLGVIRRHPEIKWLRVPSDVEHCATEQKRLLDGLAGCVAPGGELVYSVCSHEHEESTEQIAAFLERHGEFERVPLDGRIHDYYRKYLTRSSELLIYPGNPDDLDGFFAAVLRRKAPA